MKWHKTLKYFEEKKIVVRRSLILECLAQSLANPSLQYQSRSNRYLMLMVLRPVADVNMKTSPEMIAARQVWTWMDTAQTGCSSGVAMGC